MVFTLPTFMYTAVLILCLQYRFVKKNVYTVNTLFIIAFTLFLYCGQSLHTVFPLFGTVNTLYVVFTLIFHSESFVYTVFTLFLIRTLYSYCVHIVF